MKKTFIMVVLTVIVGIASSYVGGTFTADAGYKKLPKEKVAIVEKAMKEFKEEKGWDGKCTLDGKQVSLEGMVLSKIANESSYGEAGVGARTNNRGNIHGDLIGKAKSFIHADNTSTYPTYKTPEDGLKNLAQWLKNKGCKASWQSSWNYVKGPRAERSKENISHINKYHARVVEVAMAYDQQKDLFLVDTVASRAEGDALVGKKHTWKGKHKDGCFFVKKIRRADYLQIDQNGEMKSRIDLGQKDGETLDVFNCYE